MICQSQKSQIRDELCEHLRPEFVNRIDDVVSFRTLGKEQIIDLIDRQLQLLNQRLAEKDLVVSIGDGLIEELVALGLANPFGGRGLKRAFRTWL